MKRRRSGTAVEILERIDRRIAALRAQGVKASDRAISEQATGSPHTLGSIRKGVKTGAQTGISTETLDKFAPVLQTGMQWLLTGSGSEMADDLADEGMAREGSVPNVPLLGFVRAGAAAVYLPLHESELDRVAAPPGSTDKTRALEIRGDSLGELFDRWLVYFDDEQRPISPDLINRLCIVELSDGRIMVKKIKRNGTGGYDLHSNTEKPITGVQIKWAARVKHMAPR